MSSKKLKLPEEEICSRYQNGETSTLLVKAFNCSSTKIFKILRSHGVKIKTPNERVKKYSINDDFFEKVDSEIKAYLLGFLYADGCVNEPASPNRSGSVSLMVQSRDIEIINLINAHLFKDRIPKLKTSKGCVRTVICSRKIFNDLIRLGCTPRKSLILDFPSQDQVPDCLIPHFIRGLFDGDGCININKIKHHGDLSFVGASKIMSKLDVFIQKLGIKTHYRDFFAMGRGNYCGVTVASESGIRKLFDFMYGDANFFLKRKFDKFQLLFENQKNKPVNGNSKPILQINKLTNQVIKKWNSATEAAKALNKPDSSTISTAIKKKSIAYGFKWEFDNS